MQNLVVFDIDGCLLDNRRRLHLIEERRWDDYFNAWESDTPIAQGIVICRTFLRSPHYKVLFITSRSERSRDTTLIQLRRFVDSEITNEQLWMRPNGVYDSRKVLPKDGKGVVPDTELKLQLLAQAGYKPADVFFMYEDRNSTVKIWREAGVMVLQPQDNDF